MSEMPIQYKIVEPKILGSQCARCSQLIDCSKHNFFAIHGNITIGLSGGIVGNNLNNDGEVVKITCYHQNCLISYLTEQKFK